MWKEMFVAKFWYYPSILLQELMKSMKNVSQDSQFPADI
jgi:hypothetical protein